MGMQDRDWYRDESPQRRVSRMGDVGDARGEMGVQLRGWSVATWLLVLNIAAFVIDALTQRQLVMLSYFSIDTLRDGQVWRLLTFQFMHADAWHLLVNMIGLYFFGPMIEYYFGSRRFLAFYLLCGLAGAAAYMGLWGAEVLVSSPKTPLVGASAGIFGILMAGAVVAPNTIVLIYGIIPAKLRWLALGLVGYGVYMVLTAGENAGGEAGHLGGALVGFLLIKNPKWLDWADRIGRGRGGGGDARRGPGERRGPRDQPGKPTAGDAEIDRILEKVSREGLASLSDDEKRALAEDTEQKRNGG